MSIPLPQLDLLLARQATKLTSENVDRWTLVNVSTILLVARGLLEQEHGAPRGDQAVEGLDEVMMWLSANVQTAPLDEVQARLWQATHRLREAVRRRMIDSNGLPPTARGKG
jgi:hypothetical protein